MTHVALGFLANLMALAAIGIGPSLWLMSGRNRAEAALAVGPVVGLVLVSVVGTMLTLLDLPVSLWSLPVLVVGSVIGLLLAVGAIARDRHLLAVADRRRLRLPLAAFACTGVLVLAPQLVGGLQYSILRGNGSDSFNYLAAAGALDHEPLSWMSTADPQALAERHPSYPETRKLKLLEMRWTTMMLLAFSSRVASLDPYKFEYAFSVLCLLLAFGPVYFWCHRLIGTSALTSALAAAAVSAGFWGQFVVDERADAHQNAIPVVLLLAVLAGRVESGEADRTRWGEHALLGLTGASLLFIYPEIVPVTVLGLGMFLALRFAYGTIRRPRLAGWIVSAGTMILAAVPLRRMLTSYLVRQFTYASAGTNTWHLAYFRWLYSSPLTGLWGLGPLVAGQLLGAFASRVVLISLGALLTIGLVASIAQAVRPIAKNDGTTLAATLAVAAITQAGYLFARGQLWASGKSLSFGYPFFIISIVGYGLSGAYAPLAGWRGRWRVAFAAGVTAFLVIQAGLAFYRPWLALRAEEYVDYMTGHGEYRRHQWDLAPIERVLAARPGATVWLDVSNPWLADYLGFALGWRVHLVNVGTSVNRPNASPQKASTDRLPQFVIVSDSSGHGDWRLGGRFVAASTSEFSLIPIGSEPVIAAVDNPNDLEGNPEAPFFWVGGAPTVLKIVAAFRDCAWLRGRFSMGPSRPDLPDRHLTIWTTVDSSPTRVVIEPGEQDIRLLAVAGLNEWRLRVEEAPTVLLPTDSRPLLLRVDDLRLERVSCAD